MSGLDLYYWLKDISHVEAAVIGGVISGIIIVFCQWYFRWAIRDFKKDTEKAKRLHAIATGEWPEHIQRAARTKLRNKTVKEIMKTVLSLLLFIGIAIPIYLIYSDWSEKNDEEIRKGRLEHIEHLDDFKSLLKLRTIRTTISGKEATIADELMIIRWESMCSIRARIEGDYKGRHDSDRILITRDSYRACMLERGWDTEPCEDNEKECVEVPFSESVCTSFTRKWLEDPSTVHEGFFRDCTIEVN